jgi:large subunit ribosomal protein L33
MAAKGDRVHIKLKSSESPYVYHTQKNKRKHPDRMQLRKYDPVIRKYCLFKEEK